MILLARSLPVSALVAAVVSLAALLPGAPPARAQEISVLSDEARNEFPTGVTFTVSFRAPAEPRQVRLRYELAPDGTGASAVAECSGSGTVNCTYTLASGRGIFVIPGAEITYHWEIEDEDGNRTETADVRYVHTDTRFDFRTMTEGNVTVYFHPGTEQIAPSVLTAAIEALENIGRLEQAQVTFPIKVFVYSDAAEMQPAIAPSSGRGVQILGEVVYSDTAMVAVDISPLDITRHEVAHIVTREATRGPFDIPGWLNEGISVFAQRNPLAGHENALQDAIRGDRVLSMTELSSPSAGGTSGTVGLYYGQSGSIVRYLVETYGPEKFADLIRTFDEGATPDNAFRQVYGLDALGLENEWRASVGLAARTAAPTPTPRPTEEARAQPTSRPNGDGSSGARTSDGDDGGFSPAGIVVIAVLLAAAAGAGAFALNIARQRI